MVGDGKNQKKEARRGWRGGLGLLFSRLGWMVKQRDCLACCSNREGAFLEDPGMVESTKIWTLIKFRIGPFTTKNVFGFVFFGTSDSSELRTSIGA